MSYTKEKAREYRRAWKTKNREAWRELQKKYKTNHKESIRNQQKEHQRRTRLLAIEEYGGKCACCGESEPRFLCFDHINGDGWKMRKGNRKLVGLSWYNFLIKNHPSDIRLLCHNCNMAYAFYGSCPHQENGNIDKK